MLAMSIDGYVTGDNKIYCDVGKVDLELDDNGIIIPLMLILSFEML